MRSLALTALIALAACTDTARESEIARVRDHLERVERELEASSPALTTPQAENRARVIQNLRRYIEAERYPTNRTSLEWTPIFIDDDGARCALAALVEASGHQALVERIARDRNLASVHELADDRELGAWLLEHGISLNEAARIQPGYPNRTEASWQPTGSLIGSVQGSGGDGTGAHVVVAPGIRVGARRVTDNAGGACDRCTYTSMAFVAEYSRTITAGSDSNQLSLLLQWDLSTRSRDHQLYVIGGPVSLLDDDVIAGAQAGFGFSFRNRVYPLFAELIGSALDAGGDTLVRAGANFGVVW